jgi:putative pyruvate formate lyase activating enzyme
MLLSLKVRWPRPRLASLDGLPRIQSRARPVLGASFTYPCSRTLHLAPPFLLDDYVPRYINLSSIDAAKKRSAAYAHLRNCNLCPRLCGVNRYETTGMCLIGEKAKVNVIAPHFGEEPCVQGHFGSGSVFFRQVSRCTFVASYADRESAQWLQSKMRVLSKP